MNFRPEMILVSLRNDLNRCMPGKLNGWLFCGLHAYFNSCNGTYGIHFHGQAFGEMIERVDALREYRPAKYASDTDTPGNSIQIIRDQDNLPEPITYCMQSFWNWRYYWDEKAGECREFSHRRRIPEPFGSIALLWLDQFRLEDLTLIIGLRATYSGLATTKLREHEWKLR